MFEDIFETDDFYKLIVRNKGKTILIDVPNQWVLIKVDEQGNISSDVARTFEEIGIPQKAFDKAQKSGNLKRAISDVFDNYKLKRAFVVENEKIEEINRKQEQKYNG